MNKLAIAAAALMLAGCAHKPPPKQQTKQPQVNRAMKSDKYAAPKKVAAPVAPMPVPNEVVKKRWFPKFKVQWLHK